MTKAKEAEPTEPDRDGNPFAVLIGWTSTNLGGRMVLRLQGVNKAPPYSREDIEVREFYLSKDQAAQLGQYLFAASGQTAPHKRGKLSRWLDGM